MSSSVGDILPFIRIESPLWLIRNAAYKIAEDKNCGQRNVQNWFWTPFFFENPNNIQNDIISSPSSWRKDYRIYIRLEKKKTKKEVKQKATCLTSFRVDSSN